MTTVYFHAESQRLCATLTPRERDILILRAKGESIAAVAQLLHCGRGSVIQHAKATHIKLDVHTVQEAAVIAAKAGLV